MNAIAKAKLVQQNPRLKDFFALTERIREEVSEIGRQAAENSHKLPAPRERIVSKSKR